MGYRNPVWHNGMAPSINDDRLNDLCYTVERLDFADGRVVVGQKEGETLGTAATSEGVNTVASGDNSHSEGSATTASGNCSHSEGRNTTAEGNNSHAEGNYAVSSGANSHAEGYKTLASASSSHAEGAQTTASGLYSHAEGECEYGYILHTITGPLNAGATTYTIGATDIGSFPVGMAIAAIQPGASSPITGGSVVVSKTATTITVEDSLNPDTPLADATETLEICLVSIAGGIASHSEGCNTSASGDYSHAEGYATVAYGENSHAEGNNTIAAGDSQHVFGQWNAANTTAVEIVGGGASGAPKNIRTLDRSGNMTIAGTLTQSSDAKLKTVEGEIPDVSEIHAVRFRWNDVNGQHDDLEHVGYIAQDVEKVAPFMVKKDSNGYKALDYIAFLCAKMELLERRVKELEEKKG